MTCAIWRHGGFYGPAATPKWNALDAPVDSRILVADFKL